MENKKMNNTMTGAQLLISFENACFQLTHFPTQKKAQKQFYILEEEVARRLGVNAAELMQIRGENNEA